MDYYVGDRMTNFQCQLANLRWILRRSSASDDVSTLTSHASDPKLNRKTSARESAFIARICSFSAESLEGLIKLAQRHLACATMMPRPMYIHII